MDACAGFRILFTKQKFGLKLKGEKNSFYDWGFMGIFIKKWVLIWLKWPKTYIKLEISRPDFKANFSKIKVS